MTGAGLSCSQSAHDETVFARCAQSTPPQPSHGDSPLPVEWERRKRKEKSVVATGKTSELSAAFSGVKA